MCLAVPLEIVELKDNKAVVERSGVRFEADIRLLKNVKVGDFVLVHAGFAIQKVNREEAQKTLELYDQMVDR
ncbi:MAG: HypC/HybG/HupF family hydrogenase formation chaperone [Kosmotoga sp.]|nr:MAG: HypC/HybG/HupF family hydrogenase formation chaperone [Kosmotoga sp.]